MNKTSTFDFMGQQLRVALFDNEPWFVAADVCKHLDLDLSSGTFVHLKKLADDEKKDVPPNLFRGKGMSQAKLISESGLYRLTLRADKWEARAFQDWVRSSF